MSPAGGAEGLPGSRPGHCARCGLAAPHHPHHVYPNSACGTAGFLVAVAIYLMTHYGDAIYEDATSRRRLRHGDTVLATVRTDRGSYFLALNPPENRVASTGFAMITPTKAPWSFIYAALTLPEVSDHLGQMADGGAYTAVRPEIIGAMQVVLPNEPKILEAFHRSGDSKSDSPNVGCGRLCNVSNKCYHARTDPIKED